MVKGKPCVCLTATPDDQQNSIESKIISILKFDLFFGASAQDLDTKNFKKIDSADLIHHLNDLT